jgi:hypothetical protein
VTTVARRRHHGFVEVVGGDFVALRTASGGEVLLVLTGISSVRTAPRVEAAAGERLVTTDLRLTEVLAELVADRAAVVLVTTGGGDPMAGTLRAVGHDVVTVRTGGDDPATGYVPASGIVEVALA